MPSIVQAIRGKFLIHRLVYLAKAGSDQDGRPAFADPVELPCRWDDVLQETVTADGRTVMARVKLLMVDPVEPGSLVWQGTLAAYEAVPTYPRPPTFNQGGREVINKTSTAEIKRGGGYIYEVLAK